MDFSLDMGTANNVAKAVGQKKSALNDLEPIQPERLSMLDNDVYRNLKSQSMNKGLNPWASLALSRQRAMAENLKEEAAERSGAENAMAMGKLAAQGGLSSGARERVAAGGAKNYLDMVQDVNRQGELNAMNIGISDAENKMKMLDRAAGMESQDIADANSFRQNVYNQQMQRWAAERQAQATENAGGGGGGLCFITTAACKVAGLEDDSEFLNTFRKFRDEHMGGKNSEELKYYYAIAPKIVEAIGDDHAVYRFLLGSWLHPAYEAIQIADNDRAHALYKEMVLWLKEKYLNEDGSVLAAETHP